MALCNSERMKNRKNKKKEEKLKNLQRFLERQANKIVERRTRSISSSSTSSLDIDNKPAKRGRPQKKETKSINVLPNQNALRRSTRFRSVSSLEISIKPPKRGRPKKETNAIDVLPTQNALLRRSTRSSSVLSLEISITPPKKGRISQTQLHNGQLIPGSDSVQIVRGYSNQANERFSIRSRGNQCTTCSAVAICLSLNIPLCDWQRDTIEQTLDLGDSLYNLSKNRLGDNHTYAHLTADEIFSKFKIATRFIDYGYAIDDEINGQIGTGDIPLIVGLTKFFSTCKRGLFTSNGLSVAIFNFAEGVFLFDSHSRDQNGKPTPSDEGVACLLRFPNLNSLSLHLLTILGCSDSFYVLTSPKIAIYLEVPDITQYPPLAAIISKVENDTPSIPAFSQTPAFFQIPTSIRMPSTQPPQIDSSYRNLLREDPQPIDSNVIDPHHCGLMTVTCQFCSALFFEKETYLMCCAQGKIKFPSLYADPVISDILLGRHQKSKIFFQNARGHNNKLAMASAKGSWIRPLGRGDSAVHIEGMLQHLLADINPDDPKYGSIYFVETDLLLRRAAGERGSPKIDPELLELFYHRFLNCQNQFVRMFQTAKEFEEQRIRNYPDRNEITALNIKINPTTDRTNYNAPTCLDEVAAIYSTHDGEPPFPGYIRLTIRSDPNSRPQFRDVSRTSPIADPLCYPILFPSGDLGWDFNIVYQGNNEKRVRKRVSMREYYAYRLMCRDDPHPLHHAGRLFQQYVIDAELKVTGDRLNFIKKNQKKMRLEDYRGLRKYVEKLHEKSKEPLPPIGSMRILPSSFTGGRRFMERQYQDAMRIVAETGKPTWFVTFTCNPSWPEIKTMLGRYETPQDRPDIISRVFYLKLKDLMKRIETDSFFGKVTAWIYAIEFQKRGLPHAHILVTVDEAYIPRSPEDIDKFVSAEIPDQMTEQELYEIVMRCMVHGPCGEEGDKEAKCLDKYGSCIRKFPKTFQQKTILLNNGMVFYKRMQDNRKVKTCRLGREYEVDNRWIVEFNRTLCRIYNCHICVLFVSSVRNVKYLFKYITKGADAILAAITTEDIFDECQQFESMRYISAMEATWRLFKFPLVKMSHVIEPLPIHLPGQRKIYFEEGMEEQALERTNNSISKLEAFFNVCRDDDFARTLVYHDIPRYYRYAKGVWQRRSYNLSRQIIGRIYTVPPSEVELFHLRILLLHVKGPVSFEDLLTVNGVFCESFQQSALNRNLLATDDEWIRAMNQAQHCGMPSQMRRLFACLLCYCNVSNPKALYEQFIDAMAEDFLKYADPVIARVRAFRSIALTIKNMNRSVNDFGFESEADRLDDRGEVLLDILFDPAIQSEFATEFRVMDQPGILNQQQHQIFESVKAALSDNMTAARFFYVQGCGGSGKTFLFNFLIKYVEDQKMKVIAIAFTGIAAILMQNGRTSHNVFRFPVKESIQINSGIKFDSKEAQNLREVNLIVWDEIGMVSRRLIDCADQLMRELRKDPRPFGGCCVVFGGDIRQMLSVQKQTADQVELLFTNSLMWSAVTIVELNSNMRTETDQQHFAEWIRFIGEGRFNKSVGKVHNVIAIPVEYLQEDIVKFVFEDIRELHGNNLNDVIAQRAILCPKIENCYFINSQVIRMFPGEPVELLSVDSVQSDDPDPRKTYPEEFLNSLNLSGLPPHKLILKVGVPVILLRNLCLRSGLCNGTRMIVKQIRQNILDVEVVTGTHRGSRAFIPRIDFESIQAVDFPFVLHRRQFPVNVCFALTINKSQGQTFDRVGIFLPTPVFNHGQLYVALSRVRRRDAVGIKVFNVPNIQGVLVENDDIVYTKNIVYEEVLRKILDRNNLE